MTLPAAIGVLRAPRDVVAQAQLESEAALQHPLAGRAQTRRARSRSNTMRLQRRDTPADSLCPVLMRASSAVRKAWSVAYFTA